MAETETSSWDAVSVSCGPPLAGSAVATARALLADAVARLTAARVPMPAFDTELLLGHVLGPGPGELEARLITRQTVPADAAAAFDAMIERRAARTAAAPHRCRPVPLAGTGFRAGRLRTETRDGWSRADHDRRAASRRPRHRLRRPRPRAGPRGAARLGDRREELARGLRLARGDRDRPGLENARIVFDDLARALPELEGTVSVAVRDSL